MVEIASGPDVVRLVVLPYFGYLAWRDYRTRRVPNRLWFPLAGLGILLFAWELSLVIDGPSLDRRQFLLRVAVSLGVVLPTGYLFARLGAFGGADAKAFYLIALLFPTVPEYDLGAVATVPVIETTSGVFSLTILTNAVLVGSVYPAVLAVRNAAQGHLGLAMFVVTPIRWDEAPRRHGSLLGLADRWPTDDRRVAGLGAFLGRRRVDLDAVRMYLEWRAVSLAELRAAPERYRDPASLPAEPAEPGDGSIATDGGSYDDPWGTAVFLASIDRSAYGTTPEQLRDGLETLTAEDVVWLSPGIPFLVPVFVGLVLSVSCGDLLFGLLTALAGG